MKFICITNLSIFYKAEIKLQIFILVMKASFPFIYFFLFVCVCHFNGMFYINSLLLRSRVFHVVCVLRTRDDQPFELHVACEWFKCSSKPG